MDSGARGELEKRLLVRQSQRCFICDDPIDLTLHGGELDIDHIDPLVEQGLDAENNFALTHAPCNRSKGATNLEVARRLSEFGRLQAAAQAAGERGANLGHVLKQHGGSTHRLALRRDASSVEYSLPGCGDHQIHRLSIFRDTLSQMGSFFAVLPLEYLHHDDRINPRSIGGNIRGLIEEFKKGRPQLQIALAWWQPRKNESGANGAQGEVKIFDGQHKAAAQILLGVRSIPVRVFIEPNTDVLLQANTNAGGKLKQVAFDAAVMHHLGSSLYLERVDQYRQMRGLEESDFAFSEHDLVNFFRGEKREMLKYIIDAQRDSVIRDEENRLTEFVNWAGKGADGPASCVQRR